MLTPPAGLWLMEQEGLGQVLPPLHGNDNITWSRGRGRGGGRRLFSAGVGGGGGLENLVKGNQVATMSLHIHMICI